MTTFDDEFYRDILEGIAVHADSAFYRDVLDTITRHQAPEVGVALNKNQMASKRWLADALLEAGGSRLGRVLILGGWVGALGAVLLHDRRFAIDGVVSVDIDPRCAPIALSLNATHVRRGRFDAITADMLDLDYAARGCCGTRRSRHQHELRASGGIRSLVCADTPRPVAGHAVERLLRGPRARQLRARPRGVPRAGAACATCCSPARNRCAATFASC